MLAGLVLTPLQSGSQPCPYPAASIGVLMAPHYSQANRPKSVTQTTKHGLIRPCLPLQTHPALPPLSLYIPISLTFSWFLK